MECTRCRSNKIIKSGARFLKDGTRLQKYLCKECNKQFSEKSTFVRQSREEAGAKAKARRNKRKEALSEYQKVWRKANRSRVNERQRGYYYKREEKI